MPRVYVCPLARIDEIARQFGARWLVTLLRDDFLVTRPGDIEHARHLRLGLADIDAPRDGHIAPAAGHVRDLVGFVSAWDRRDPLLIHCYAGISRSPAAALIAVCALAPTRDEGDLARTLRRVSPTATPNKLLIAHGDALLNRGGRLIAAVEAIGRGADAFEGVPFALEIE